jgi:hypothetical protein
LPYARYRRRTVSLGALDQPLLAIGTLVAFNLGDAADLRERGSREQQRPQASAQKVSERSHADRALRNRAAALRVLFQISASARGFMLAPQLQISASARGFMLAPQLILAAGIFVGCGAAEAAASPLIPMRSGALLRSDSGIETVRWRYRHRSFWSGRGDGTVGRGDADGSNSASGTRSPNGATPPFRSEIFRLDLPRRRGWVDPPPPR